MVWRLYSIAETQTFFFPRPTQTQKPARKQKMGCKMTVVGRRTCGEQPTSSRAYALLCIFDTSLLMTVVKDEEGHSALTRCLLDLEGTVEQHRKWSSGVVCYLPMLLC